MQHFPLPLFHSLLLSDQKYLEKRPEANDSRNIIQRHVIERSQSQSKAFPQLLLPYIIIFKVL